MWYFKKPERLMINNIINTCKTSSYDLLSLKVQVYNSVRDLAQPMTMTCYEALKFGEKYTELIDKARCYSHKMTAEDERLYKDIKNRMFCWLPSCICEGCKDNIKTVYPVMCIDIDIQDNPDIDLDIVKRKIFDLPFVYYVGKSIGGLGIFCLCYIQDPIYYAEHFASMQDYFKTEFNIIVDPQCSNMNRLRFMSYDTDALIKEDTILNPYTGLKFKNKVNKTAVINTVFNTGQDLSNDDRFCLAVLDYCIDKLHYQTGKRELGWLQDLSLCKSLGTEGEALAIRLSRQSPGYKSDDDVIKVLRNRSTFEKRSNITKFFALCKVHLGKGWIYEIKNTYNL